MRTRIPIKWTTSPLCILVDIDTQRLSLSQLDVGNKFSHSTSWNALFVHFIHFSLFESNDDMALSQSSCHGGSEYLRIAKLTAFREAVSGT